MLWTRCLSKTSCCAFAGIFLLSGIAAAQNFNFANDHDETRRARFNEIYDVNFWGDGTSRSGPGSRLDSTEALRGGLEALFADYSILSVLDAACGDFWWMKEVPMPGIRYLGWDISRGAIAFDNKHYASESLMRRFDVGDIITDTIPEVDLIMARDVMVHMSNGNIMRAIANIKASGAKYLLATQFLKCDAMDNIDIIDGDYRPFDLTLAPFNFPQPKTVIRENYDEIRPICRNKVMALWDVSSLPNFR